DKVISLPADLNGLHDEIRAALNTQTKIKDEKPHLIEANKIDRKAIESDLNNTLYAEAAEKIVNFIRKNETATPESFDGKESVISVPELRQINAPILPEFKNGEIGSQIRYLPNSMDEIQDQTIKTIAMAKFWQTLIAGILIMLAGYAMYADSFMGTPGDIASVFFWAFLLDLSVAT